MSRRIALNQILFAVTIFLVGCVTSTPVDNKGSLSAETSVGQEILNEYSDDFSSFRDDLWIKLAGYTANTNQLENLKAIDPIVQDGKAVFSTDTGGFSKGAINSKFKIEGDFDIQIDCEMNFSKGTTGMDQWVRMGVWDSKVDLVAIHLNKPENKQGHLFSYRVNLDKTIRSSGNKKYMEAFFGSMRLVREGKIVYTFIKSVDSQQWNQIGRFKYKKAPVSFGFSIQNFNSGRKSIIASRSFEATFSNFRINAAENIIEGEI